MFRTVRVNDINGQPDEMLALLSKESVKKDDIGALWRAYFVDRRVRAIIEQLFVPEPDASVIELIAERLRTIPVADIRASLQRARIHFDFPVEESAQVHISAPSAAITIEEPHEQPIEEQSVNVQLGDLISAGLIKTPLQLERTYKGRRFTAQVDVNGVVIYDGKRFNSLSMAGQAARRSVIEPSKRANTNGWTFWKFRDVDNELQDVDTLRKRFLTFH